MHWPNLEIPGYTPADLANYLRDTGAADMGGFQSIAAVTYTEEGAG